MDYSYFIPSKLSKNACKMIILVVFDKIEKWTNRNCILFSLDKFELVDFLRKNNYNNPKVILPTNISTDHKMW